MLVEMWPISRPKPYPGNPRLNDDAVPAVAESIRTFGWRQPIVVDESETIIVGHTRLKAAHRLGLTEVPVHVARDLTPDQVRAYRLADNKLSELAEWNMALLPIELGQLQSADFDLGLLGFDQDELARILGGDLTDGECDPDDVPLRCLIDANWGTSTEVIYRFCRQCQHPAIVMPSHDRFMGASSKPLGEYENRPGDRSGWNWRIPAKSQDRPVRHVTFDANFWKSFIQARLAMSVGEKSSLTLFGESPTEHRLFADHLTGEYRVQTSGRGRTVDECKVRPDHPDNHWLDCVVGCAVGASIQGVSLMGEKSRGDEPRRMIKFSDIQKRNSRINNLHY
jgi:hypothetical protein